MRKRSEYLTEDFETEILTPFLKESSRNASTREKYSDSINLLCDYFKKSFEFIDEKDVEHYFSDMVSRAHKGEISEGTVNMRLSVYSNFGDYIKNNISDEYTNPFAYLVRFRIEGTIHSTTLPTIEEMDKILNYAKEDMMDYCIIALSFRCAISPSQVRELTLECLQETGNGLYLLIPSPVPSKERRIRVPEDIASILVSYISSISAFDDKKHLFYGKRGNAISERMLQLRIKKIIDNCGISKNFTLQDIRNRGILELLQSGADEDSVAEFTGITNLQLSNFNKLVNTYSDDPNPSELSCIRIVNPFIETL